MTTDHSAIDAGNDFDSEFLRMPSVLKWTGLARSTIYQLIAQDQFPAQVRLAERAVGWRRTDLARWSATRRATRHRRSASVPVSHTAARTKREDRPIR